MKKEWKLITIGETFWGAIAKDLSEQLNKLEEEGWTIHTVTESSRDSSVYVACWRPAK